MKYIYNIRQYLKNTTWIVLEKILGLGLAFIVTIILARQLGPEQYGIIAYSISLASLLSVAGHAGLSGLVVRELIEHPNESNLTMGAATLIKAAGYSIGLLAIVIFALNTDSVRTESFWVLVIVGAGMLFKSTDVIDFWFQSRLEARYSALSRMAGSTIGSLLKIIFASSGGYLILIACAHVAQSITSAIFLIHFYKGKAGQSIYQWKYSKIKTTYLLRQGWIVFLGSIFATVYHKIDQVMLMWMSGAAEVSQYAIAATLSEAWYFLPVAIVASIFPKLIRDKEINNEKYMENFQRLLDLLFLTALIAAIFSTVLAELIIDSFFGKEYKVSAGILSVHIWGAIFIFMRAAFSKWILIENVLMFSMMTQGLGALSNVLLNLWLIPMFGGLGAAYATVASYAMASYFSLLLNSRTREVFFMMTKAFMAPARIILLWCKVQ